MARQFWHCLTILFALAAGGCALTAGKGAGTKPLPAAAAVDFPLPLGNGKVLHAQRQRALRGRAGGAAACELLRWPYDVSGELFLTPGKPNASWRRELDNFCTVFDAADGDVRRYLDFWTDAYAAKIRPALAAAAANNPQKAADAHLYAMAGELYTLDQFRISGQFLHQGLTRGLTPAAAAELQRLIIRHDHAEKTFLALKAAAEAAEGTESLRRFLQHSRLLKDFRLEFTADLGAPAVNFSRREAQLDDPAGVLRAAAVAADCEPLFPLPEFWRFSTVPADPAVMTGDQVADLDKWDAVRISRSLRSQDPGDLRADFAVRLAAATAGTYAVFFPGTKLPEDAPCFLVLGASADRLRVLLNGKELGVHEPAGSGLAAIAPLPLPAGLAGELREHLLLIQVEGRNGTPVSGFAGPAWIAAGKKTTAAE